MKKKILVFLVAILVSCSGFVYAVNEKTEKEVTSIGLISIDFQGTTLYTVLNVLSMKTGMRLITDTTLYDKKIMLS
ncbi:MAG: hypothetical protein WCY38_01455, partial [Endomicrobiia bacterium]